MTLEEASKDLHAIICHSNLKEPETIWAIGIETSNIGGNIIIYTSKMPNTIIKSHMGWTIEYIKADKPTIILE